MKLTKFRITDYKSIEDTGYCWLASDLTILAGKNESGKTAILEALRDFDVGVMDIPDSALPIDKPGKPSIELCFQFKADTLRKIGKEVGASLSSELSNHIARNGLTIAKNHKAEYSLEERVEDLIDKRQDLEDAKHVENIRSIVNKLTESLSQPTQIDFNETGQALFESIDKFIGNARSEFSGIADIELQEDLIRQLNEAKRYLKLMKEDYPSSRFLEKVIGLIPHFIFFSDFSDILPFELSFQDAQQHKTVQDFAKAAGLDWSEIIKTDNRQRRRNILSTHSASITGNFKNYYQQDKLDLIAEPDGDILRLGVRQANSTLLFSTEQRSKGFQWFLSFYLRLSAEKAKTNILLIDEPGLYLHARAQKDVLSVLEDISKETHVIFSTHSPYLISPDRLDRVRLVLKHDSGTHIENKIHKGADQETLTPIITAIGLDVSRTQTFIGSHNVLLEGITDYYHLQALKEYITLKDVTKLSLIPCVGAPKISQLASLFIGWDLEFAAVLDNDATGKREAENLKKKLSVDERRIVFVSEKDGFAIEDLFTPDDFNSYVLGNLGKNDGGILNSKFVKNQKFDNVLLAKTFFEKVKKRSLMSNCQKKPSVRSKMFFQKSSKPLTTIDHAIFRLGFLPALAGHVVASSFLP